MINPNNPEECEACFAQPPVHIPLITCAHSNTFCERCMKSWLANGHSTCPKCRARLPIKKYLEKTRQNHVNIAYASLTVGNDPLQMNQTISSSSKFDRLVQTIFTGFSIGLLLGLIVYPVVKNV